MNINVKLLDPAARAPYKAHESDAAIDLFCLCEHYLDPGIPTKVRTGIALEIPRGFMGLILDRSSMARDGFFVTGGVIDSGYRGEIQVLLTNSTSKAHMLTAGQKVAQMAILPCPEFKINEVLQLMPGERDTRGWGSSGA